MRARRQDDIALFEHRRKEQLQRFRDAVANVNVVGPCGPTFAPFLLSDRFAQRGKPVRRRVSVVSALYGLNIGVNHVLRGRKAGVGNGVADVQFDDLMAFGFEGRGGNHDITNRVLDGQGPRRSTNLVLRHGHASIIASTSKPAKESTRRKWCSSTG